MCTKLSLMLKETDSLDVVALSLQVDKIDRPGPGEQSLGADRHLSEFAHRLRRDAPGEQAIAPELALRVCHHYLLSGFGQTEGRRVTRAPGADHENVSVHRRARERFYLSPYAASRTSTGAAVLSTRGSRMNLPRRGYRPFPRLVAGEGLGRCDGMTGWCRTKDTADFSSARAVSLVSVAGADRADTLSSTPRLPSSMRSSGSSLPDSRSRRMKSVLSERVGAAILVSRSWLIDAPRPNRHCAQGNEDVCSHATGNPARKFAPIPRERGPSRI